MKVSGLLERIIEKRIVCALILWATMCLVCASTFALDRSRSISQFHHTAWTARDGAPSQISVLAQTNDGYLWIGSALGLFRFDGVTFEQYAPPDGMSLPSNNIYALMPTPDGGLWISFRPSGIGFLKDGKLRILSRPEELPKSQVYSFARTNDGKIWAGTHNGLAQFNGSGWIEIGADRDFQPNRVRKMFVDRSGTLWVSTDDSMDFLLPGAVKFQKANKPDKYAIDIAQAKDGRLWAAKYPKLISPINNSDSSTISTNPEIIAEAWELLFDRDGSLWTASSNQVKRIRFPEQLGTEKIAENDSRIESFKESDGLSGSLVNNILEDREGNIWVGTTKGLDRFRYSSIVPVALPDGAQKLTLAATAGGEIWAGVAVNELFLHLHGGQIESFNSLPKDISASSVYRDESGVLWWGMRGGILRQQDKEFKFFPQPKEMALDWMWEVFRGEDDGGLWVNFGDEGLIYFKDGIWERRKPPEGLPDRGPSATFEDARNRLWLGYTENRVFVVDGKNVRGYLSEDGIEIGRVKVIRGRGENIWCGGETGLAVLIDNKFHTVKTNGKSFGAVAGIIETENGDLWLNEIHGIVKIPASEIRQLIDNPEYPVKYRLFDFQDNLPGGMQMNYTVSTAVEGTDKRLWFATDNGLAVIDPSQIEKNELPPPVLIKSVSADGKNFAAASELKFPPATVNLQINYTALSLAIPERVVFKYRLENFETEWREAGGRREAFYTNLAPGKYRFQVISANNDGVWNEQGAILNFEILPAFYQTKWFLLLCFVALAAFTLGASAWRVREVKLHLQLLYEERLAERTRIAQDLHDTLLQGMVGVSMQLDSAVNKLSTDSPAKPRFERMREMMTQIIGEGRNTVNGLRSAEKMNVSLDLEKDLKHIVQKLNAEGKTKFRFIEKGSPRPLCSIIHDEVYYICHEALANALQHSGGSEVSVVIEYTKNFVRITVRDDGIGIDLRFLKSGRKDHWGLSGMRERAKKIDAKLQISSRARVGTEIELVIPAHVAFEAEKSSIFRAWLNKLSPTNKH